MPFQPPPNPLAQMIPFLLQKRENERAAAERFREDQERRAAEATRQGLEYLKIGMPLKDVESAVGPDISPRGMATLRGISKVINDQRKKLEQGDAANAASGAASAGLGAVAQAGPVANRTPAQNAFVNNTIAGLQGALMPGSQGGPDPTGSRFAQVLAQFGGQQAASDLSRSQGVRDALAKPQPVTVTMPDGSTKSTLSLGAASPLVGAGGVFRGGGSGEISGSGTDLTTSQLGEAQGSLLSVTDALYQMDRIAENAEYFEFFTPQGRLGISLLQKKAEFSPGSITQSEAAKLEAWGRFERGVWSLTNERIREITGAQMSQPEAERIMREIPKIGDDIFTFTAKFDDMREVLQMHKLRMRVAIEDGVIAASDLDSGLSDKQKNAISNRWGIETESQRKRLRKVVQSRQMKRAKELMRTQGMTEVEALMQASSEWE